MSPVTSRLVLGFAGTALLAGIGLAILGTRPPPEPKFKGRLIDLLPTAADLPGWTVTHLPIADTPEMQRAVDEALNFDDAVCVEYRNEPNILYVYIAYWRPGNMQVRNVARHTPDVCWIAAGWNRLDRSTLAGVDIDGQVVRPAEYATFQRGRDIQRVLFWHIAGNDIVAYGTHARPPIHAVFTDLLRWGASIRQEQFFVRISGNLPGHDLLSNVPVRYVITRTPIISRKPE